MSIRCYLQVSVVIDDARVECDAGPINFKPTVMFYKWAVQTLDGAPDTSGTYMVSYLAELCLSLLLTSTFAAV